MIGLYRHPTAELRPFVESLWYFEAPAMPHAFERLLPDAAAGLIIDLDAESIRVHDGERLDRFEDVSGALVFGAQSRPSAIATDRPARVVGVQFRVGGAHAVLGLPGGELRDRNVALEDLWGGEGRTLRERLLEADTAWEMLGRLEQALLDRRSSNSPERRHPAVRQAIAALSSAERVPSVGELGASIGLSARRLLDLFEREVGLTPKLFARLCRFHRVADRIWRGRGAPTEGSGWADLAADCGFADQSHLIREFREFSGVTPAGYAARLGHHRNHIPL
jgi:AraC-like DNA-binding protein